MYIKSTRNKEGKTIMKNVRARIFTKPSCPYCVRAKELLKTEKIPFDESTVGVDVTKSDIQDMVNRLGVDAQITTVPQIFFIHQDVDMPEFIGGYTELNKYIQDNK